MAGRLQASVPRLNHKSHIVLALLVLLSSLSFPLDEHAEFVVGNVSKAASAFIITTDDDGTILTIDNPYTFRNLERHHVVIHGVISDPEIHVIGAATIDNHSDPLGTALLQAATYRGDPELALHLLNMGANPNAKTSDGSPALIEVIETGLIRGGARASMEITRALLDRGADPNSTDRNGQTPLIAAAFTADRELVRLLLAHGANVNAKDNNGLTPLMGARGRGVVEQLVAAGADVNDADSEGRTSLMHAAWRADPEVVKALIAARADINAIDHAGESALSEAKRRLKEGGGFKDEMNYERVVEALRNAGARDDE